MKTCEALLTRMSEIVGSFSSASSGPSPNSSLQDVGDEGLALGQAQRRALILAVEQPLDDAADFGFGVRARHLRQPVEVQPVQQILMDPALERLVLRVACVVADRQWSHDVVFVSLGPPPTQGGPSTPAGRRRSVPCRSPPRSIASVRNGLASRLSCRARSGGPC